MPVSPTSSAEVRSLPVDISKANKAISGTSGTWTQIVTGIDLTADFGPGTNDNFGIQDIWEDPHQQGVAYLWTCFQGCYKTVDYGITWRKISTPGGPLDFGKNWGQAVAANGFMYATSGNNADTQTGGEGRKRVFRSFNGGVSWDAPVANPGNVDPYNVTINPVTPGHLLSLSHDDSHLYESLNYGATWTDAGEIVDGASAISISGYVHWVNGTTALACSQTGGATGLFKCVKSGSTWTFTHVNANIEHDHGAQQICIDRANNWIYVPCEGGIYRSAYDGDLTSWTQVSSTICTAVAMTGVGLYGIYSFPSQVGQAVRWQTSTRAAGNSWTLQSEPGMDNGGKTLCAMTDGVRWILLAGCWNDDVWRYIE